MRLLSIEVHPKGNNGWTTGNVDLSNPIIVVQAPNGTGKTPFLKCIVYGLGLPIDLPSEIKENCAAVSLTVQLSGKNFEITRSVGETFQMSVIDMENNSTESFSKEPDYSKWLTEKLGIPSVELTTKNRAKTQIYSSILIPMLWVDQDRGWSKTYFAEKDFVWDQEEELARLFLGLPIRHPFSQREDFEKAKSDLQAIEARQDIVNRAIAQERRELGEDADIAIELINKEVSQIQKRLETLGNDLTSAKLITAAFDDRIIELKRELSAITNEKADLANTIDRFGSVESELSGEIELLGTNVSAAKAFRTFCGGEKCKLFAPSEASYGKRLLYLADQVKDIQREVSSLNTKFKSLSLHEKDISEQVTEVEKNKDDALKKDEVQASVELYKSLINRIGVLESKKNRLEKLSSLRTDLSHLINNKEIQKTLVENLTPGKTSKAISTVKSSFSEKISKWLGILGTRSLPHPTFIDDNLKLHFGDQDLRSFSGSTLIRILLAYRTSLYEEAKAQGGPHPGVLIMDAPRQHEVKLEDFKNYFESVYKTLARDNDGLQLIISVSDEVFPQEVPHRKIEPSRQHNGQMKYFGPR